MACPRGKHPKKNKQKRDVRRTMPTGPGKFGAPCPSQIKSKTQAQPEGGFWSSDLTCGNGEEGPKTPESEKPARSVHLPSIWGGHWTWKRGIYSHQTGHPPFLTESPKVDRSFQWTCKSINFMLHPPGRLWGCRLESRGK